MRDSVTNLPWARHMDGIISCGTSKGGKIGLLGFRIGGEDVVEAQ